MRERDELLLVYVKSRGMELVEPKLSSRICEGLLASFLFSLSHTLTSSLDIDDRGKLEQPVTSHLPPLTNSCSPAPSLSPSSSQGNQIGLDEEMEVDYTNGNLSHSLSLTLSLSLTHTHTQVLVSPL